MSSLTPNLNLVLPDGGEHVSRQVLNDNSTIIDTAVGSNSQAITNLSTKITNGYKGMAYLVDSTNGGTTIPAGAFVYVNGNNNGVADGLYTANEAIGAYWQITTSRVTAVSSGGGLNALNSKTITNPITGVKIVTMGNVINIVGIVSLTASVTEWQEIFSVPDPASGGSLFNVGYNNSDNTVCLVRISSGKFGVRALAGTKEYRFNITYIK